MRSKKFSSIEEYFSELPPASNKLLQELRTTIKQVVPNAEEVISYNMPALKLNGVLVYYAAQKNHIGFYPTSSPIKVFKKELEKYKTSKGAIQFPLDKPIPKTLVKAIVKYRLKQDQEKAAMKTKK